MQERFSAACRTVKIGDTLTTKQLVEMGYTDDSLFGLRRGDGACRVTGKGGEQSPPNSSKFG